MYAVIRTGGKQYKVAPGELVRVEKLPAEVGAVVRFDQVLFTSHEGEYRIGKPLVEGVEVEGEIRRLARGRKVIAFKKLERISAMKTKGHRQWFSEVFIRRVGDVSAAAPETPAAEAAPAE